jgi:Ca2+-binding RTX toxin-like protein
VETLALNGTGAQAVTLGAATNLAFATGITITTVAGAASLNLAGALSTVSITATGTNAADTMVGGTVADILTGGASADSIDGGAGNDTLVFASEVELSGDATVIGGADSDTIRMDTAAAALALVSTDFTNVTGVETLALNGTNTQAVTLGAETDAAFATGITITTVAGATSLNLAGALSTRTIHATGTSNADTMVGGTLADTLTGGAGADSIDGGAGADAYVYAVASDSAVNNTAVAATGFDTVALTTGDTFDFGGALVVVQAATVVGVGADDPAVDGFGSSLIFALNALFVVNDDNAANREAMVIRFDNTDQYIVADQDGDQAITASDTIIKITGVVTGLTLTGGDAVVTVI